MHVRRIGWAAAVVFAISWFLPAAGDLPGYEAFWLSLKGFFRVGEWELASLPLAFAWLANVGAVGALRAIHLGGTGTRVARAFAVCGLFALGPALVSFGDMQIAYWLWAGAILILGALAWRPGPAGAGRRD
ncbi:MAG: hypothetical protein AB7G12_12175 [Thermoanaerobaculia bacterium]